MDKAEFERLLGAVVAREIDGCTGLTVRRATVRRRQPGDLPADPECL